MKDYINVNELIEYAVISMRNDGFSKDYITQLSYTWNQLVDFLKEKNLEFDRSTGSLFLKEKFDINDTVNYSCLSGVSKRRKRAINILINCLENDDIYIRRNFWPCRFDDNYNDIFSEFIRYRKTLHLALTTVNRDIYSLNHFSKYLNLKNISNLSNLTVTNIEDFVKWLSVSKKPPTLKSITSSLRLLLRYMYLHNYISSDLSSSVHTIKVRKTIPSIYSQDEIKKMLESYNRSSAVGLRNYAMILLAACLGIRASDICLLKFENISWDKNTISFITKKTKQFTVLPLTAETGNAIIDYLKNGRPNVDDPHIFLKMSAPFGPLSPSSLYAIVTEGFRHAGINTNSGRRSGPHALRASLATSMLQNNTQLSVISDTLSHSNSDTTKIYLKVDVRHLKTLSLEVPDLKGVWMGGVRW